MYTIQKASMLKRISAFLLDFILMTIAVTGFAFIISLITGYSGHLDKLSEREAYYESKYYPEFGITEEQYNALGAEAKAAYAYDFDIIGTEKYDALTEAEKTNIMNAYKSLLEDDDYSYAYSMLFNLTLIMITFSLLLSFILLEMVIPKIFGNGQTVGKKVFALGIVHVNAVRLSGVGNFTRVILGKFTVETMIPVIMAMMLFTGGGLTGLLVLGLLIILEIFVFFKNKLCTPIHDVLAQTVCVDMSVQLVYENEDELIKHKERIHAEIVKDSDY